jgi:DNA-binding transcriptional MerR regulator
MSTPPEDPPATGDAPDPGAVGQAEVQGAVQGRITRAAVARRLDLSVSGVRVLERTGELHPNRDENGVHMFDADEVRRVAEARGIGPEVRKRQAARQADEAEENYWRRREEQDRRAWQTSMNEWADEIAERRRQREERDRQWREHLRALEASVRAAWSK